MFDRIAILGAGAVGAYYGGRLAQHGRNVSFYTRSDCATLRQQGLTVQSLRGDFVLSAGQVKAFDNPADIGPVDLVIVTLKATAKSSYADLVRPLLHARTAIFCLQNGLGNEEEFARHFGADRVLGAIAFVCINRIAPAAISHTAHGLLRLGEFNRPISDRLRAIATMFKECNIECDLTDDLRHARWEKLIWNIPFNGLGAMLDRSTDQLLAAPGGVELIAQIMAEVVEGARAVGVTLDPALIEKNITRTYRMGAYHTSMQLDRRAGRALELDAIFAEPLQQANQGGAHLPRIASMLDYLRLI